MRNLIIGAVIIIVLAFIFMRGDQLAELADTMSRGSPIFLVLAIVAQLGKYTAQGFGYRACFHVVGENIKFGTGLSMVFGAFFMNTIAPSLNLAGTSLIVDTAYRRGVPAGKATSAAFLMQLCIDTGFVCIMLITFGVLSLTVGLQPGWFLVGLLAVVLVGGLALVMILGGIKPHLVERVLHPFVKLIDRILVHFKRGPIDDTVSETIHSFSGASKLIVKRPKRTLRAFSCSLVASLCEICCFSFSGLAFGIYSPAALVCGYVVATLFAMISIVPQGVGVVEAASLVSFGLFGIDGTTGMAAIMVYRGIVFWMPFIIGAVMVQILSHRHKKLDAASSEESNEEVVVEEVDIQKDADDDAVLNVDVEADIVLDPDSDVSPSKENAPPV